VSRAAYLAEGLPKESIDEHPPASGVRELEADSFNPD
jgi:hypothetical protein